MKTWLLMLTLFSSDGELTGIVAAPGVYTKAECSQVKAMFDRDHQFLYSTDGETFEKHFANADCADGKALDAARKKEGR